MPVQDAYGSSHISGGVGFMPSQEYTPKTANQNLPHDVMYVAPPPLCICTQHASDHVLHFTHADVAYVGLYRRVHSL